MNSVLLDTHALAWTFAGDAKRIARVASLLDNVDAVFASPISIYEIGQKVRLGKWPEMEPFIEVLSDVVVERGGRFAALDSAVCLKASLLDWDHRDPFDRIIAATAMENGLLLASTDTHFDHFIGQDGWVARVW